MRLEELIAKTLIGAGPWAILFWWAWLQKDKLIDRIMKESREREERLMACLGDLNLISKDVQEIKNDVATVKEDVKVLKDRR